MIDRRSFLKSSAAGVVGVGLAPSVATGLVLPQAAAPKPIAAPKKVIRRTLGRTGLKLPVVSMGVMNADNPAVVKAALEAGIVHFDTANGYQRGRNEEMLGEVFKDVRRESIVVSTKLVWPGANRQTGVFGEADPKAYLELLETSLKRLKFDHVDILYVHNVAKKESALFEPVLKLLTQWKKEGRTRFIGLSTHGNQPEVIRAAIEAKVYDVVLTSYNFKLANVVDLKAACAEAAKAGIGLVAMKTQAGAFYDKEKTRPINMQAALKWVLQDGNICTAIPGFTTFDQLALDLPVMGDIRMTAQEKADLEGGAKVAGLFCQQCETCVPQCPKALPIPDLMRGYMYASGYQNLLHAKDLVASLDLPEAPCGACDTCNVACAQGFEVRSRIADVLKLRQVDDLFLA
jgi:uncharacterized protein